MNCSGIARNLDWVQLNIFGYKAILISIFCKYNAKTPFYMVLSKFGLGGANTKHEYGTVRRTV